MVRGGCFIGLLNLGSGSFLDIGVLTVWMDKSETPEKNRILILSTPRSGCRYSLGARATVCETDRGSVGDIL